MAAEVYRMFGADGELLYIGVTTDFALRMYNHAHDRTTKAPLDRVTRIVREVWPDVRLAAWAEEEAIRNERPLCNKPRARVLRDVRLRFPEVVSPVPAPAA